MIRRKGKTTRKLLSIKDRNLRAAKIIFYIFQFIVLSLSFATNIKEANLSSYIMILGATVVSNILIEKILKEDLTLILIANTLFTIGAAEVYRLDPALGNKHLKFYLIGLALFFIVYILLKVLDKYIDKWLIVYFAVAFILFLITQIKGQWIGGAKNWISIGNMTIQPSEFIKIPFVFFIASFYANYGKYLEKYKLPGRLIMTIGTYIFIGFFFLQRELGTAVIFFGTMILTQFVYEKDFKLISINTLLMIVGLFVAYKVMSHIQVRINVWKDPFKDAGGEGYQIVQSLIAIASGGLFGTGIGNGHPNFVPVAESDFIFVALVEEMGVFMGIAVLMLFLLLVYKGMQTGFRQENKFLSVLAFTVSTLIAIQTLLIVAGIMKIIPLTGVTLPFVSAGGSSMLAGFILLACLQYAQKERIEYENRK